MLDVAVFTGTAALEFPLYNRTEKGSPGQQESSSKNSTYLEDTFLPLHFCCLLQRRQNMPRPSTEERRREVRRIRRLIRTTFPDEGLLSIVQSSGDRNHVSDLT